MESHFFADSNYRPCMVCDAPGRPKAVAGLGHGVEVRRKDTGDIVGYLHANCKDAWTCEFGEIEFSFRLF